MEFVCLVLFLLFYFFRPQEWLSLLNTLRPVQLITFFAVYALFNRAKGFKISDVFQTPHDWLVFAYFAWIVFGSPTPYDTFKIIQAQILFYIVGVQALSSIHRIKWFLGWWTLSLMLIAGLAVASEYGFDPFGSYDLTHGMEKGRLSLNLSIFNNPNGLAHTLVPVIPMVYFLFFWKKSVGKATLALLALPLYCIFLTESKGAFLCSFVTICTTLTFGRPKLVQITILVLAGVFGTAALYSLPRMNELQKTTKGNEAIGGRVAAFKFGYECMQKNTFGIGLQNFVREFFTHGPMERYQVRKMVNGQVKRTWAYRHYQKATHGAYNQNGAELGYGGLMLFVGVLYSCLRTLMTMKKGNEEEERVRRALFSIVISYIVSCWMVDFGFRPTFFLFVAATGAFHRLIRDNSPEAPETDESAQPELEPIWRKQLQPVPALNVGAAQPLPGAACVALDLQQQALPATSGAEVPDASEEKSSIKWRRIGLIDVVIIYLLTQGVIKLWLHFIQKF